MENSECKAIEFNIIIDIVSQTFCFKFSFAMFTCLRYVDVPVV